MFAKFIVLLLYKIVVIKKKIVSRCRFVLNTLKMCAYLETLVEHRTKIVRAKKPLVASSFLQGNLGPAPGYLILITAEILYNFAVNCFCKEAQLLLWYTLCMLLLWNLATVLKMYHKLLWQNLTYKFNILKCKFLCMILLKTLFIIYLSHFCHDRNIPLPLWWL